MMNEVAAFSIVLMAGFLLGALFFGGLWWTVQKGLTSQNPILWFFGSTLLRTGFAVTGFYFTSRDDWKKFVLCLVGFVIARVVVTRLTQTSDKGLHAP
jgi:F1F0 ATPase subunit 2